MNRGMARDGLAPLAILLIAVGVASAAGTIDLGPPVPVSISAVGQGHEFTLVHPTFAGEQPGTAVSTGIGFNSPEESHYLTLNPDPAVWLGTAMSAEMQQAGFQVVQAETPAAARTPLVVAIAIQDVSLIFLVDPANPGWFNDNYVIEGRVLARIEIYRRGTLVQKRTYSGTLRKEKSDPTTILTGAFNDLLRNAAPDLAAALVRAST